MKILSRAYEDLINPINMRLNFKSEIEFVSWLETGSIEDLECALNAFTDEEMYEDCALIRDVIQFKLL